MPEIYVKLFGGEKDGYDAVIPKVKGRWPEMFYVHRNCDDKRISDVQHHEQLHEILANTLAILAYKYNKDGSGPKEGVPGGKQYRYDRCEAADKKLTDPAV